LLIRRGKPPWNCSLNGIMVYLKLDIRSVKHLCGYVIPYGRKAPPYVLEETSSKTVSVCIVL
jgi:hypothetical protein